MEHRPIGSVITSHGTGVGKAQLLMPYLRRIHLKIAGGCHITYRALPDQALECILGTVDHIDPLLRRAIRIHMLFMVEPMKADLIPTGIDLLHHFGVSLCDLARNKVGAGYPLSLGKFQQPVNGPRGSVFAVGNASWRACGFLLYSDSPSTWIVSRTAHFA